jgi:cell division protein FtsB
MSKKNGGAQRWLLLGGILAGLAVVGLIGRGIWQQMIHLQRLRATEAELQTQIQYEQERKQQLKRELQHISSPDYPEEWARRYGGMVQPGEIRLVVPDSAGPTPTPP